MTPSPILKELSSAAQPIPQERLPSPLILCQCSRDHAGLGVAASLQVPGPLAARPALAGNQLQARPTSLVSRPHVLGPTPVPPAKRFPLQAPTRAGPGPTRSRPGDDFRRNTSVLPWTGQPLLAGPPFMGANLVCLVLLLVCACVSVHMRVRVRASEYAMYTHPCACLCSSVCTHISHMCRHACVRVCLCMCVHTCMGVLHTCVCATLCMSVLVSVNVSSRAY